MKETNFNKNDWHCKLYLSTFGGHINSAYKKNCLPDDTCLYYKKIILALILFIPALPGHIYNFFKNYKKDKNSFISYDRSDWTAFHLPFLVFIGWIRLSTHNGLIVPGSPLNFWHSYLVGIVIILLIGVAVCILFSIIWFGSILYEQIGSLPKKPKITKETKPNFFIELYKSLKGKYCSKINWKLNLAINMRNTMNYSSSGGDTIGISYSVVQNKQRKPVVILNIPYEAEKFIEHAWRLILMSNNIIIESYK